MVWICGIFYQALTERDTENRQWSKQIICFSAKGNIEAFANNTDAGESARNELIHLKSALFAF